MDPKDQVHDQSAAEAARPTPARVGEGGEEHEVDTTPGRAVGTGRRPGKPPRAKQLLQSQHQPSSSTAATECVGCGGLFDACNHGAHVAMCMPSVTPRAPPPIPANLIEVRATSIAALHEGGATAPTLAQRLDVAWRGAAKHALVGSCRCPLLLYGGAGVAWVGADATGEAAQGALTAALSGVYSRCGGGGGGGGGGVPHPDALQRELTSGGVCPLPRSECVAHCDWPRLVLAWCDAEEESV